MQGMNEGNITSVFSKGVCFKRKERLNIPAIKYSQLTFEEEHLDFKIFQKLIHNLHTNYIFIYIYIRGVTSRYLLDRMHFKRERKVIVSPLLTSLFRTYTSL